MAIVSFLDKFTTVHRSKTFEAIRTFRERPTHAADFVPYDLREEGVKPKSVPIEYIDPKLQAGFEAVYKDRLYLLRVPRDHPAAVNVTLLAKD